MNYWLRDGPHLLDRASCFELLNQVDIGRVGVSIDALPVVLPVHFVLSDEAVLLQTVRGTKLDAALLKAVAAFQADAAVDGHHWSVLIQGMADELDGNRPHVLSDALTSLEPAPHDPSLRDRRWIRIDPAVVSGRVFHFGTSDRADSLLPDR